MKPLKCLITTCDDQSLFTKQDMINHLIWHGLSKDEAKKKSVKIKS